MDTEITILTEQKPPSTQKVTTINLERLWKTIRDMMAVTFWLYAITKLFIYDIDILLVNRILPKYLYILDYKIFILSGSLALAWLITKNKHIVFNTSYICFFPFILLFWKLPYFVFRQKSWVLAFSIINSVISFFKSIKYNFIITTSFAISFLVIMKSSNNNYLYISAIIILAILVLAYIHRTAIVFRPSSIFQIHKKLFSGIYKQGKKNFSIDESIRILPIDQLDKNQLKQRTMGLQSTVIFNKVCLFTAKKLRDYQNSKIYIISYIISLLILVFITALSFTVINFALFKVNSNSFHTLNTPSIFSFFYYSFNKLFFNSVSEISPISMVAQISSMLEMFLAFFTGVIFVVLVFSVRSEKYALELNSTITSIEQDGRSVENIIIDEYQLSSIDAAIQELIKVQADFVGFIQKISKAIDNA